MHSRSECGDHADIPGLISYRKDICFFKTTLALDFVFVLFAVLGLKRQYCNKKNAPHLKIYVKKQG